MDTLDPVVLARVQFAANITFHILFPTISIAMGWFLLFFKTRFVATGEQHWMDAYQFWIKIFALTFALGVVSGITMSFQFGIFLLSFYGLAYSLFPWLVIDKINIWQAASSPEALLVIFYGVVVVLPIIIAYTVFSYRVFWGKSTQLRY